MVKELVKVGGNINVAVADAYNFNENVNVTYKQMKYDVADSSISWKKGDGTGTNAADAEYGVIESTGNFVDKNGLVFKTKDAAISSNDAAPNDAVAQEVAGYVAKVVSSDAETVIAQRYDGSWLTSAQVLDMLSSGELETLYANQQATFIANGALEAEGNLTPAEFVLSDLMVEAGK